MSRARASDSDDDFETVDTRRDIDLEHDEAYQHYLAKKEQYELRRKWRNLIALNAGTIQYEYDPSTMKYGKPIVPPGYHLAHIDNRTPVLVRDDTGLPDLPPTARAELARLEPQGQAPAKNNGRQQQGFDLWKEGGDDDSHLSLSGVMSALESNTKAVFETLLRSSSEDTESMRRAQRLHQTPPAPEPVPARHPPDSRGEPRQSPTPGSLSRFWSRWTSSLRLAYRDVRHGRPFREACAESERMPFLILTFVLLFVFVFATVQVGLSVARKRVNYDASRVNYDASRISGGRGPPVNFPGFY